MNKLSHQNVIQDIKRIFQIKNINWYFNNFLGLKK